MRFAFVLALAALSAAPVAATAQAALSDSLASRIIAGCAAHAKAKRQSHAIAVVDPGGHPVAQLRMDGNASGIAAFALQKASAVAHWRFPTADMATAARETPGFASAPHVVTVGGGVPVYSANGQTFIGAVGVSGEAAADDVACAEAGIRSAGLHPKRGQPPQ